jgi:hypothetical protein
MQFYGYSSTDKRILFMKQTMGSGIKETICFYGRLQKRHAKRKPCIKNTRLVNMTDFLVLGILGQCEGKFTEKSKE